MLAALTVLFAYAVFIPVGPPNAVSLDTECGLQRCALIVQRRLIIVSMAALFSVRLSDCDQAVVPVAQPRVNPNSTHSFDQGLQYRAYPVSSLAKGTLG